MLATCMQRLLLRQPGALHGVCVWRKTALLFGVGTTTTHRMPLTSTDVAVDLAHGTEESSLSELLLLCALWVAAGTAIVSRLGAHGHAFCNDGVPRE